jgi:hypothetical protein
MPNSKLLPIMKPCASSDYPLSRAKQEIRGTWYVPNGGDVLMLATVVTLKSGMEIVGFQCSECKKTFIIDSIEELYHECMGVA